VNPGIPCWVDRLSTGKESLVAFNNTVVVCMIACISVMCLALQLRNTLYVAILLLCYRKEPNAAWRCVEWKWFRTFWVEICDCAHQRDAVDNAEWDAEFTARNLGCSWRRQALLSTF